MARDIKFRAWFRPTDEYKADYVDRYGKELPDLEVEYYTEEVFLDDSWVNIENYEQPIVFEQYTGLKDKNGKEIYEGDIMRYDAIDYKVLWADYYAGFETKRLNSPWNNAGLTLHFLASVGRVIGNIHENLELLEGEKNG